MRKSTLFLVAFGAAFLVALVTVLLLYGDRILGRGSPPPIVINAAQENAVDPYRAEMACIDQLMQRHDMEANQVQAELERCRGGPGGSPAAVNGQ